MILKYVIAPFFSGILFFFIVFYLLYFTIDLEMDKIESPPLLSYGEIQSLNFKDKDKNLSKIDSNKISIVCFYHYSLSKELESIQRLKKRVGHSARIYVVSDVLKEEFIDLFYTIETEKDSLLNQSVKNYKKIISSTYKYILYKNKILFYTNKVGNWDTKINEQFLKKIKTHHDN